MTQAVFVRGSPNRLTLDGHAGYRPGEDIVCAAISALVYALIGYLDSCGAAFEYDTGDGFATVECEGHEEAFDVVISGLSQLAEEYPSHVSLRCV